MTIPHPQAGASVAMAQSPSIDSAYRVEVVSDHDALWALRPAWDALTAEAGVEHPFLSHEWNCTWWECFGGDTGLRILLVKSGARLVGIAPLMRGQARMYGLPVRRVGSLYNPHTPRCDFVVAPDAPGAWRALWRHLCDVEDEWDVLEFPQLPPGSRACDELQQLAVADGFRTGTWSARGSPYLAITGSWDDYLAGLRAKHRSNLRNRFKRLGALGEPRLEVVSAAEDLTEALEDGFRLEAAGWKGGAGTAMAARAELRRFYARLAERMAARGRLRLQFLTVNGRRIAFGYSLWHENRLYLLKPGYDPAYALYSPANLLRAMVLRDAFERGLAEHDFLGVDDAWKLEWTSAVRPHRWLYVFSRAWRGRMLHAVKFRLVPALKRRRPSLRLRPSAAARSATRVKPLKQAAAR